MQHGEYSRIVAKQARTGGKSSELYYNAPHVHPANKQPYNTTPIKREDADTKVCTLNHLLYYSAT